METEDKLVSIITPCYNGENYIKRYIECILSQKYKKIELIIINDGSTDKTDSIIKSYADKLEDSGIIFQYMAQENLGQAAALNKGLKIFLGDYLIWQDCDDILDEEYVKDRVEFLNDNPQCGIVCGSIKFANENNLKEIIGQYERRYPIKNLFYDLIIENNVCFNGYMTRRKVVFDVLPDKNIYESRAGQNWQMLLPITYKYSCGYIKNCTYTYVIRENSHSHSVVQLDDLIKRTIDHEDILLNVIESIEMRKEEKLKLQEIIRLKYIRKRLTIASNNGNTELCRNQILNLKEKNDIKFKDYVDLILSYSCVFRIFYKFLKKIKNKIINKKGAK